MLEDVIVVCFNETKVVLDSHPKAAMENTH